MGFRGGVGGLGAAWLIGLALASSSHAGPVSAAPEVDAWFFDADFAAEARRVGRGGRLRVEDVPLGPPALLGAPEGPRAAEPEATSDLELERFEVFSPGATIVVNRRGGRSVEIAAPDTAYFRGSVDSDPRSLAFLAVEADGEVRGMIAKADGLWILQQDSGAPNVTVEPVDPNAPFADGPAPFDCSGAMPLDVPEGLDAPAAAALESTAATSTVYAVKVAVETDYEFYDIFGSAQAATAYVGDLFAASSAIYLRDTGTVLQVGSLSLWSGGFNSDPWTASTTSNALAEFRSYWNANRTSVDRTIAHFLSGKPLGGGIAYLGVLCSSTFGYGVTGSLNGEFSTTSSWLFWDLLAVSHELGHNFSSSHTHCYSPPVDNCYNGEDGCYAGATTAIPTNGGGSIMSYCHLSSGGYSNINFWFGRDEYYGTDSERVPTQMRAHVESRSWCLDTVSDADVALTASPTTIQEGQSSVLTWTGTDVDTCTASGAWSGSRPTSGSLQVSPSATATYDLECTGSGGTVNDSVTVTVIPAPTVSFQATPASIRRGESATLSWSSTGATTCSASGAWYGTKATSGSSPVQPGGKMSYSLTCTGSGGSTTKNVTIDVELPGGALAENFEPTHGDWSPQGGWDETTQQSHSPTTSWTDSPGGNYGPSTDSTLWSPSFDLSRYGTATLRFWNRRTLADAGDVAEVWVDGAGAPVLLQALSGSTGWAEHTIDLTAHAGTSDVRVGFRLVTNASGHADGWYVDDVVVEGAPASTFFYPLTPCRLVDTRLSDAPYGGQALPGAATWYFDGVGTCGIPAGARAVAALVKVVSPQGGGYLTLFPGDVERPVASVVNFPAFENRPGNTILALPMDGAGDYGIFNGASASTHVVIDVTGYFE
jgi:hypothetical protein